MPNDIDYYQMCEDALAIRLQTLKTFFPHEWQVSDDDTVLGQGADNFIIYRPGRMPMASKGEGDYDIIWYVVCRLHVKYLNYKTAWKNFKELRSAIINLIIPDFTLSNTQGVWRTAIEAGEDAQYFYFDEPKPGVKPNFVIQDMSIAITQRCRFET